MNHRKSHGPLEPKQCKSLEHAWQQAAREGYPLNALISIRPLQTLTPLEHVELVNKTWNRVGVWSRRNTSKQTFHAILVRETLDDCRRRLDHFHLLLHVESKAALSRLRDALARWFPEPDEAHVRAAHQRVTFTPSGKIMSAIGYVTKERTRQAAWPNWQARYNAGAVLGKRYRLSANLAPG
jgi:hypothetical protein